MKNALFLLFTSLGLVGCCSIQASGDRYNVDYITPGMTKEQVVEIMKDPMECVRVDEEEVMLWNGACVSLVDNKVVDKTPLEVETALYYTSKLREPGSPTVELVDEIFGVTNDRVPTSEIHASLPKH